MHGISILCRGSLIGADDHSVVINSLAEKKQEIPRLTSIAMPVFKLQESAKRSGRGDGAGAIPTSRHVADHDLISRVARFQQL